VTHGADTSFLVAVEIIEHALHTEARRLLEELLAKGDRVAIAPQVLAEFVHVVTDPRRFQKPFSMQTALDKSERWWNATETEQVLPGDLSVARFHSWMRRHQLGRKRVLDTLLAATYRAAGVTSVLTLNPADFMAFGEFACLPVLHPGAASL
jgi:predicted nucleic acid-binding protein